MSNEDIAIEPSQAVPEQAPAPQGKMMTQDQIDSIVQARLMREREHSMGGMQQPQFDEEALIAKAAERMQQQMDEQRQTMEREQQKAEADEIAKTYYDKMSRGKELYDDFDAVTEEYSPAAYPQVTIMASQYDNLPDIMYELSKNPTKLTHLHVLALTNPQLAKKEMLKLSQSIKKNEEALVNNQKSPAPLSKLKSSVSAGQDTGKKTIADLRKESRFRG